MGVTRVGDRQRLVFGGDQNRQTVTTGLVEVRLISVDGVVEPRGGPLSASSGVTDRLFGQSASSSAAHVVNSDQ